MDHLLADLAGRLLPGPGEPPPTDGRRRAAVAAVFTGGDDGPSVLLMKRAQRAGDPWSGHVSLPGGRHEPSDPDLRATAVRETVEELALDLAGARYLGRLPPLHPRNAGPLGMEVTPFVFACGAPPLIRPGAEAETAFWLPIRPVLAGQLDGQYQVPGMPALSLPCWRYDGYLVWGLTMRILAELLEPFFVARSA